MTDFSLEFVFASGEKHSPKAEPSEWLLRSDADTVADNLTVRFSAGKRLFTEEPVGAVLKKDGAVIFDGIVDEHRVKCRNGARTEVSPCAAARRFCSTTRRHRWSLDCPRCGFWSGCI